MNATIPLALAIQNERISLTGRHRQALALERAGGSIQVGDRTVSLDEAVTATHRRKAYSGQQAEHVLEYEFTDPAFCWTWELTERATEVELRATIRNMGQQTLSIGAWNVLHVQTAAGGGIELGAEPSQVRFFGWHPWNMRVEVLDSEDGEHNSHNICHLYDPASGLTLMLGFVTLDRMLCHHHLGCALRGERAADGDTSSKGGVVPAAAAATPCGAARAAAAGCAGRLGVREYRATCTFGRYPLAPGQELASETLRAGLYADPYSALESWAHAVHEIYRPGFADRPPVGWCGTGIQAFSDREPSWEAAALENARLIRKKLAGFDVGYVWTSQHNLKDGLPGNWLTVDRKQIPGGLPQFFTQLRQMGFMPGLWVAPFWFFAEADGVLEGNRDNLLRDQAGEPIREPASWEYDRYADPEDRKRLTKYYLDGSHPQTREYLRRVFGYYRDIGVRYYMLDFLAIKEEAQLADLRLTHLQAARSVLQVIRETAGDDTHLQTAVSSTPGFIGLIDAARVGRDFGEGRPLFPPYHGWANAAFALHDEHFGSTRYLVQNAAASYFTHRRIYLNDFNLLTIDKPMPLDHARIAVTVFGLGGGSPLMLGDDFRRIDPERLRMIKLCMPRTQDVPVPVDLFDEVYPEGYCRTLKGAISTAWDTYLLVAVFNLDEGAYETNLDFARLGLAPDPAYRVYEFWREEYLGTFRQRFRCVVPERSCRLYRISRARPHPWLLSTDMHVQQGAVEIETLRWDDAQMTLSGTATRPAGEHGNLFILMPRRFSLVNHEETQLVKDVRDMNVIVRRELRFSGEPESFAFRFQRLATQYMARRGWLPYATEEEWLDHVARSGRDQDTRVIE